VATSSLVEAWVRDWRAVAIRTPLFSLAGRGAERKQFCEKSAKWDEGWKKIALAVTGPGILKPDHEINLHFRDQGQTKRVARQDNAAEAREN